MAAQYRLDDLMSRAQRYFSRPSYSAPVFLGDDRIAFLDDRSGTTQVSLLVPASGQVEMLTSYDERVQTLKGSARSGRIVFGMDEGGNERQQIWTIDTPAAEPRRLTYADTSIHEPGVISRAGDYVLYRSNTRDERTFDVVGMPTDGARPEIWLEGGGQVSPVDIHPDGEQALVIKLNGNMDSDLLLVTKTGGVRNLTEHDGEQWVLGAAFDSDGTGAWLLSNLGREFVALMHLGIESGEGRLVYESAWDIELFKVSPDGSHIVLSVNEDGASRALIIPVGGETAVAIEAPLGAIDQFTWSPDSTTVAFGLSTVERPSVIMVASLDGSARIVADASSGMRTELPTTFAPESIRYPTFDGREIPAFFFRPQGEGPFPVLVDIHGGPESQRRLNYAPSGPVLQYLTSLGMAVLSLNVRGSTGYGKEYSHLDDKAKRLDAVKDVEYAVRWLRSREDVAGDRIAVYGRSYGGFMTLASLVFYPDLWAAGVDMVGIANFVSFLERTGPWRRTHREAEYGELENDREMLERISPMNHIDKIVAPLLVVHGRNDPRVPLFEAEQIVKALKSRGQEVELRVYDNEGHALSKRPNVLDAFALMGAFLTKHLQLA